MTDRDRRTLKKVFRETCQTSCETITLSYAVLRTVQQAPWLCVESYEECGNMGEQLPIEPPEVV
jgi:hypothetical protein